MKNYVSNKTVCRQRLLIQVFIIEKRVVRLMISIVVTVQVNQQIKFLLLDS